MIFPAYNDATERSFAAVVVGTDERVVQKPHQGDFSPIDVTKRFAEVMTGREFERANPLEEGFEVAFWFSLPQGEHRFWRLASHLLFQLVGVGIIH